MLFRHSLADDKKFFVFLSLFFFLLPYLFSQSVEKTERSSDAAGSIVFDASKLPDFKGDRPVSLFDYSFGDNRVEFLAQGYWQSTVTGSAAYSFGFGTTPGFSFATPVFAQKVDLSLWFMLNRHWYFEASFADQFKRNTVAAGYVGEGLVKSVRVSNRSIVFPSIYSVDEVSRVIGGGENQAPGISANLSGDKWQLHLAARYDMLKSEEKTWYGKSAVSTNNIPLSRFMTGIQFVLPTAEAVSAVKDVYVESSSGSYRDAKGRTYKKLSASQYLLLPNSYTVLLSKDAAASRQNEGLPAVAFAFSSAGADAVAASAGQMIKDLEDWFAEGGIEVEDYFLDVRTDPASSPFVGLINGEKMLFVQHPSGFSPFSVSFRYDAGVTAATDGAVASQYAETNSREFGVLLGNDELSFVIKDFFALDHTYADIYCSDLSGSDLRNPRVRYPLAEIDGAVYLGFSQKTDLVLKVRSYTAVTRFDIGTDAVPGTVRVYKNGILDGGAHYDSQSGSITLSTAVSPSDHIRAVWYKDSEAADSGAFAGAAGFEYRPLERLSTDVSTAARWTYAGGRKFADAQYAAPGYATLASRVKYSGEEVSLSNTMAASLETTNTTGTYRILGMNDAKTDTVYLAKNAALAIPSAFKPQLSERKNGSEKMPESLGENRLEGVRDGYNDSGISGYAVPLSWKSLSDSGKSSDYDWAGLALKLPGVNGVLASATSFSIALKNQNLNKSSMSTPLEFKVYLQLGVRAENSLSKLSSEDRAAVPCWLISKVSSSDANPTDVRSAFVLSEYPEKTNGWQTVSVTLTDADRSRLALYPNARIIICSDQDIDGGEILIGPYQAEGAGFALKTNSVTSASTMQMRDGSLSASKVKDLNTGTNYVQQFDWRVYAPSTLSVTDDFTIFADRYYKAIDLQNYENVSLWFKYNPQNEKPLPSSCQADCGDKALVFVLDRPEEDGSFKTAVEVSFLPQELPVGETWHFLSINLATRRAEIDGSAKGSVKVNTSVIPVRFRIKLNTADASDSSSKKYYETGSFSVDELHLSGASPSVVLQDKARASWKRDGPLLESGGYAFLKDVTLSASGSGSASIKTADHGKNSGIVNSTVQAAFTLTEIRITGDAAFSSDSRSPLSSAAHTLSTAAPLGKVLSFSENYSFNSEDKSLEKADSAGLDFTDWGLPLSIKAQTSAQSNSFALTQKSGAELGTKFGISDWQVKAGVEQKQLPSTKGVSLLPSDNYGRGWLESSRLAFDTGSEYASRRGVNGETSFALSLPWKSLTPKITVKTAGVYKSSSKETFSDDSSLEIKVPFAFDRHHFSVSWKKSGGGVSLSSKGGNYARDMGELRSSYSDMRWFLTSFPVYDLISSGLSDDVLADSSMNASSSESLYYSGVYEAAWKRGFYGGKKDLFMPSSVTLSFVRDIRTASTSADVYQIKSTIGYNALNIFGLTGVIPVASWFEQDEYAASFSGVVKIPRTAPENYSLLLTGYIQASFFVTKENSIKTGLEGSFENRDNWSAKVTAIWKRLSYSSPLVSAYMLFRPNYDKSRARLTRTDSMNLGASRSKTSLAESAVQKYSAAYNHALDIAINRFITLNTVTGASYACTWDKIVTVTALLTLGATIKF